MVSWPWSRVSEAVQVRQAVGRVFTATDGRDILDNSPDGWEVEQPWLWWGGPPDGSQGPWGNPPPGADWPVGRTLPAVTRCTQIICATIAGLPWHVMRNEYERLDTPDWISDPQANRLDGRVVSAAVDDVRLSAVDFWTDWIRAALWYGDGYVYVPVRDSAGAPRPPLWQLNPSAVVIEDGRYWVGDQPLPEGSILHLRGEPPYTDGHGRGVLTTHAADLGLALNVRGYAAGQYGSGVPAGYLKSTMPHMDQTKADELKAKWLSQHGGSTRSIAVLNATTEFVPVAVSPLDAQLDAARQWSLRDIAMAFGLPGYMLGVSGDSQTYANAESRHIELKTFSLLPWMRRIESCLDAEFPRGTELEIKSAGLERADTATRMGAYAVAERKPDGSGWLLPNEIRALEGLPPLDESDVAAPVVPLAAVPASPAATGGVA